MQLRGKVVALHIGAHKTATSLVQHWMLQNQQLHRKHGLQYLRREDLSRMIGWGERVIADPAPLTARIDRFLVDPRFGALIGSYENVMGRPFPTGGDGRLYPNAARNIAALEHAVGRSGCKVVLSIRPQTEFLESYYLQTLHEGGRRPFSEWVKSIDLDGLSWRPMVEAMQASFGRERVSVIDFRAVKQGPEPFVRYLLKAIDPSLNPPWGKLIGNHNRSVSARGMEMALAVNPHLKNPTERVALRRFLQKHFSNADGPRPELLPPEEKERLWAQYRDEYEQLVIRP